MKNINVYGSGCKNCVATAEVLEKTATAPELSVEQHVADKNDNEVV